MKNIDKDRMAGRMVSKTIVMILFVFLLLFLIFIVAFSSLQEKENEKVLNTELSYNYLIIEKQDVDCPERIIYDECPLASYSEFKNKFPSNQDYWIKMDLSNHISDEIKKDRLIYFNYPNFNKLDVYYMTINGSVNQIHVERKLSLYPYFELPKDMAINMPIVIRANHIVPFYEIILTESYNFFKKLNTFAFLLMFSYGIIFAFILLNVVLGYYFKDKHFLFHAFYLLSVFFYDFHSNGLLYVITQKFYPNYYYLAFLTFISMMLFAYQYLEIKMNMPKMKNVFMGIIWLNVAMFTAAVFGYGDYLFVVGLIMAIVISVLVIITIVYCYFKKIHISSYFVYGAIILGIGEGTHILLQLGVLPKNIFTQYGFTFALAVEATLFTMSILDRVNELKEYNHRYYNIAITDHLTELYNRHYLEMHIEDTLELCRRYDFPVSIVMLDIDHFKQVNDQYGHDVGDIVLTKLSMLLKKATRKNDIIARWGGEEFVVIMLKSNIDHAVEYAEKIRQIIGKRKIHNDITVTISLGVSQWTRDEPIEETFKRADEGLYLSKRLGRNRISAMYQQHDVISKGIQWSSVYEFGHSVIDLEHKNLLKLANELLVEHWNDEVFKEKLNHLVKEISSHFISEEEILKNIGYEDLNFHQQVHAEVKRLVIEEVERFNHGEVGSEKIAVKMLQTYIMGHLITEDIKFFDLIKKRNFFS